MTRRDAIRYAINGLREKRYEALNKVWADYDKQVRELIIHMVTDETPVGSTGRESALANIETRLAHFETKRTELERRGDPDAKSIHYVDGYIDALKLALNTIKEV